VLTAQARRLGAVGVRAARWRVLPAAVAARRESTKSTDFELDSLLEGNATTRVSACAVGTRYVLAGAGSADLVNVINRPFDRSSAANTTHQKCERFRSPLARRRGHSSARPTEMMNEAGRA
jgi:hypothetical protein